MLSICFVHSGLATFVKRDMDILKSKFEVTEVYFQSIRDLKKLALAVKKTDIVYSWFGLRHALFANLFGILYGKKRVVVAGGYDVANVPEIRYGLFQRPLKKWSGLFVFKTANMVIPVSNFSKKELLENTGVCADKVKMIYHGFPDIQGKDFEVLSKKNAVLTVGGVDWERLSRKGYDIFIKTASLLPEFKFILVGKWYDDSIEYLKSIASPNVEFTGFVRSEELCSIMRCSSVYVQPSVHEAFGCSVAEAMLFGCIPVVSSSGALPEVVGDSGIIVSERTPDAFARGIRTAFERKQLSEKAKNRIQQCFPINKREKMLLSIIEGML